LVLNYTPIFSTKPVFLVAMPRLGCAYASGNKLYRYLV
jgi:hypothetical protein